MAETQTAPQGAQEGATLDKSDLLQQMIKGTEGKLGKVFDVGESEVPQLSGDLERLLRRILEGKVIPGTAVKAINAAMATIDKVISDQMNEILHSKDFQKLESAWRGLDYLVANTPRDEKLKVAVLQVTKTELSTALEEYDDEAGNNAWDRSPIFRKIYESRLDMPGG